MRCLALAEGLAARDHEVVFVADLEQVPWALDQVTKRGFAVQRPPDSWQREAETIARLEPWLVVVDSYLLPGWVYGELRGGDAVVLSLVDGDPGDRIGDLVLDQNIGADRDRWPVPTEVVRLAGLDYALMRDDILAQRPSRPRVDSAEVPTVFAFFGGTDPFGAAPRVARLLAATERPFDGTFVSARPELDADLTARVLGPGQRLSVVPPVADLAHRVNAADIVLSAAGTSSWELLCLGAAAAMVCVADNQARAYGRIVAGGLAGGLAVGLGQLAELDGAVPPDDLLELLESPSGRGSLRRRGWEQVDGLGRDRVIEACEGLRGLRGA
jgi:spore coat polysaccharide biosynthesis predicted glycosyltransferase SpsG